MDKDNTSKQKQKVIQFYKKYQKTTNKPESKYVFPTTSNVMEGIIHNFRNIVGLFKKKRGTKQQQQKNQQQQKDQHKKQNNTNKQTNQNQNL